MKAYIIMDATANTGANYIGEDGGNVFDESDAKQFDTAEEAEGFAKSFGYERKWWHVEEAEAAEQAFH